MTLEEAITKTARMAARLPEEMARAEARNLEDVRAAMVATASGPMGKARGKRTPPLPIGRISEVLVNSFQTEGPEMRGDVLHSEAWNSSPEAALLDKGTKNKDGSPRIAPRLLPEAAIADVEPKVNARREAALDKALG